MLFNNQYYANYYGKYLSKINFFRACNSCLIKFKIMQISVNNCVNNINSKKQIINVYESFIFNIYILT